jgi:hypothetical protein
MSEYKWTYEGPNFIEFFFEILLGLLLAMAIVAIGEWIIGYGPDEWMILIIFLVAWTNARVRLAR